MIFLIFNTDNNRSSFNYKRELTKIAYFECYSILVITSCITCMLEYGNTKMLFVIRYCISSSPFQDHNHCRDYVMVDGISNAREIAVRKKIGAPYPEQHFMGSTPCECFVSCYVSDSVVVVIGKGSDCSFGIAV